MMVDHKIVPNYNYMARLRVPCALINVDSPRREKLLKEGVPIRSVEDILGNGSFGTVIKAIYKGKQVAVKIIDNLDDMKKSTVENEANILGWRHANIIKILKIDSGPRHAVIIMEQLPGQCLQNVLDEIKVPLYHVIHISLDISNALRFCHERNLVHLDIKPKNILVAVSKKSGFPDKNYECKLCDFGSSMFLSKDMRRTSARGTVRYMAPELFKKMIVTTKSDIFSLGITIWQIKVGRDPYAWIVDNEAVAYNVVRRNLRPDSNRLVFERDTNSKYKMCCLSPYKNPKRTGTASRHLKPTILRRSASPFQKLDRNKQMAPINLNRIFNSLSSEISQLAPRDIKVNHPKLGEINGDLQLLPNEEHFVEYLNISNMFLNKETKHRYKIDSEVEKLYTFCWRTVPDERPTIIIVLNTLNAILAAF